MSRAELWSGEISDEVYTKIISLMECVHNLDGNYDLSEVLEVAKVLQDFTVNDMENIDELNIDIHDEDDYEPVRPLTEADIKQADRLLLALGVEIE